MDSDYKITMEQAETEMACYRKVFDDVWLYDEAAVDALKKEDDCGEEQHPTHQCMGHVAVDAFYKKEELSKLEFIGDDIYQIMAKYLEIDGKPYVMELLKSMDKNYLVAQGDRDRLIRSLSGYNERLYSDVLTKVYNRRYFEEELKNQKGPAGIAMIDLDDFKLHNDTYGHKAGDMALATVTQVISRYIRKTDILVRYGGDEFLLIIPNVKEAEFTHRLQEILDRIHAATIPGYARIQLSVSIGGTIASADETIESVVGRADRFMYQAKTHKNLVVTETNEIRNQDEDGTEVDRNELKQQILIVDDSELNRTILADILGDEYNFIEAENGARAIELLRTHTDIDLILLDMVMPEMNGFDVLTAMNNNRQIEDIPNGGDSFSKDNIKFSFLKWWCNLILNNLNSCAVTYHLATLLQCLNSADIQTNGRIEFQGTSTCCCLRITKHYTDFLTKLIDKDNNAVGFADNCCKFTESL